MKTPYRRPSQEILDLIAVNKGLVEVSKDDQPPDMRLLIEDLNRIIRYFEMATKGADDSLRESIEARNRNKLVQNLRDAIHSRNPETTKQFYLAMGIETWPIKNKDLDAFSQMRLMDRRDWLLTYSIDVTGGIYPQVRWGKTPYEEGMYAQGVSKVFDALAIRAWLSRKGTGRFFISEDGVFCKENIRYALARQLVRFELE